MRGLLKILEQKYGKKTIETYRRWEKMEAKVSDFKNHRRFSLRCLDQGLVPVSLKLKNLTRTQKGEDIIKKAEKQLLNERIRSINYTLVRHEHDRYMYKEALRESLEQDQEIWNACVEEVEKRRELRHHLVMKRQISKFNNLMDKEKLGRSLRSGRSKHPNGRSKTQDPDIRDCPSKNNQDQERTKKWVINLSTTPLTKIQEDLLSHGPNFAVTPQRPPLGEYIKSIEVACQSLDAKTGEELRSEVFRVLRKEHQLKPNLKREEFQAMKQLKADQDRMVLTADKGVALVVMDKKDYIKKAKELLEDTNTYRVIKNDPTSKLKNRLVTMLRKIKNETGMQENNYRRMYPTGASPPKFYGLPKIHKSNIPLRPIVSSIGSVSYGVAKELARIIKPLMGNSHHHVQNSTQFAEEMKTMKIEEGECITSYDVTALFTSIPVPSALNIIKEKLEHDADLTNRTKMSTNNIIELLGFCLNNTYFMFQEVFYEQTKGAAMGSPISPIIANIFMEAFEEKAITTAIHPPRIWKRYVDDTFVLQQQKHKEEFLQHINTVDPSIKFTVEEAKADGSIPFLDTIIKPKADGTFTIGVYRKPTHTDLYLPWDSNHNIAAKYSVINTLTHRALTISSTPVLIKEELKHLEEVLKQCKYPEWAIKKIFHKQQNKQKKQTPKSKYPAKCHIVIPYSQGIGESLKNICKKHGVDVHFKGGKTLKNILVSPKDRDKVTNKNSVIYSYTCGSIDCGEEYVGESSRTFGERYREHLKAPSPIFLHQNSSGHQTTLDNFKIIGREDNNLARTIKESMFIRVNNPTLNRNIGKYNLPHIWDNILYTIPELKMN